MSIQNTHTFTVPDGKTFISFADWIKTLSADDQTAFAAAESARQALVAQHQAAGYLIGTTTGKLSSTTVYTEEAVDKIDKGEMRFVPAEWKAFFERYQAETGITLNSNSATV